MQQHFQYQRMLKLLKNKILRKVEQKCLTFLFFTTIINMKVEIFVMRSKDYHYNN